MERRRPRRHVQPVPERRAVLCAVERQGCHPQGMYFVHIITAQYEVDVGSAYGPGNLGIHGRFASAAMLWLKEEAFPSGLPLPHRSAYLASQARKETTERTSKSTTFTWTRRRRTAT